MMGWSEVGVQFRLVDSTGSGRDVRTALEDLFDGDGTVYLVTGFFTYNGFRDFRDDVIAFLERSPENRLTMVVGPSSDQFSPQIARDLWSLDHRDQVEIYKYTRGLHAKLYLRDGPDPHLIMGSANLTQVGFKYNRELGIEIIGDDPDHPQIRPFQEWIDDLVEGSEPLTPWDLLAPMQVSRAVVNWTNKGRLLPRTHVMKRVAPVILLLVVVSVLVRVI